MGPHRTIRPAQGRALRKPVRCSGSPRDLARAKTAPRLSAAKRVGTEVQGKPDWSQGRILSNSSTASASLRLPLSYWRSTSLISHALNVSCQRAHQGQVLAAGLRPAVQACGSRFELSAAVSCSAFVVDDSDD